MVFLHIGNQWLRWDIVGLPWVYSDLAPLSKDKGLSRIRFLPERDQNLSESAQQNHWVEPVNKWEVILHWNLCLWPHVNGYSCHPLKSLCIALLTSTGHNPHRNKLAWWESHEIVTLLEVASLTKKVPRTKLFKVWKFFVIIQGKSQLYHYTCTLKEREPTFFYEESNRYEVIYSIWKINPRPNRS